jgi:WD40 repeat protein
MKSSTLVPISKDKGERIIDQIWLNPQGNFQKLAVSVEFEAAEPHKRFAVYLFEATEESIFKENDQVSPTYEHRQTIQLSSEPHRSLKICRTIRSGKGFILVGDRGYVSVFDKSDEKKSSYREMYSLRLGDEENFIAAALVPSEEKLVVYSDRTSRLVSIPLSLISSKERGDQSVSSSPSDLTLNGFHSDSVIAADLSLQRPILVTVSADCTARVWNYETKKCDLVHEFGTEDPRAVAVHASGLQVLISFKDGVRLYNILRNSFKLYRETVLRSCQCVRFSSGCQFWAAASGLSVFVFDSKTFSQLASFPGHLNPVKELQWAPGDQVSYYYLSSTWNC